MTTYLPFTATASGLHPGRLVTGCVRGDEQPEGWDPNPADRQEVTRD